MSRNVLLTAWGLAIVPNMVAAFADPDGAWWDVLRLGLSTVFVLVLVAYMAGRLVEWRRRDRRL
jgi:hypothetical protein